MTSIALANVHRAQNLDRLYLAIDAARTRYFATLERGDGAHAFDDYWTWQHAQAAYEEYRAMCTAAPLNPLLESVEEEQP